MYYTKQDWVLTFAIGIVGFIIGGLILLFIYTAYWSSKCIELGYRETKYTWNLDVYCIARENQTDIVVPIEDAEPR